MTDRNNMKDECLICGAPLKYLENDVSVECAVCRKKENSKTICEKGHYVCNECHTRGMDSIIGVCLAEKSKNPIKIIQKTMALPFCHMHGPEHHVMVGSALLTAYKNAGGKIDLPKALSKMQARGKKVPGGAVAHNVVYLAICQYDNDEAFYLFHCDENLEVVADDEWWDIELFKKYMPGYNVEWHKHKD